MRSADVARAGRRAAGTFLQVSAPARYAVSCPHCKKRFNGALMAGSTARYRGFKCPGCRLFVSYARAEELNLLEILHDAGANGDGKVTDVLPDSASLEPA